MAVYFAVGTPADDGRIQDFRMIPPPGGDVQNQVLVWNAATQEPEWKPLSELVVVVQPGAAVGPLATDTGQWLTTDTGARLVGQIIA